MEIHASAFPHCTVQGEGNLPSDLRGAQAICETIRRAAAAALEGTGTPLETVSITVQVKSVYSLTALVTAGQTTLPDQNVATMDGPLNAGAVQMLADAIARDLAREARK